jgi:hypothetical protein
VIYYPPYPGYPGGGFRRARKRSVAQRQFPASGAAWSSAFPALPTPTAIYTFQDTGSPIVDAVGAKNLVQNQALAYQVAGDTEPTLSPRKSIELDTADVNEFAAAADTAHADIGAGVSRSLLMRCRIPDVSTICPVMGTGTSNTAPHWGVQTDTAGRLVAKARDGAGTPVILTINTVSVYDDAAYHDVVFSLDRSGAFLHIITESEDVTVALGALGAIDASTGLRFGASMGRTPVVGVRVSYAVMFDAYFSAAHLATFRTPA